jgi:hypothetical protein
LLPTTLKPLHSPETHQDSAIGQKAKNPAKQQPLLATSQSTAAQIFHLSQQRKSIKTKNAKPTCT